jgi:hypothetical protein
VEFGRGGTRGGEEHHRFAGGLGKADAEERARTLVDVHEDPDLWVTLQRDRDRRGPRARRNAGELDALRGELVHESCSERLRYIHRIFLECPYWMERMSTSTMS